jgi:hypothetical protein
LKELKKVVRLTKILITSKNLEFVNFLQKNLCKNLEAYSYISPIPLNKLSNNEEGLKLIRPCHRKRSLAYFKRNLTTPEIYTQFEKKILKSVA